ncbi:hypothetical protein [Salinicoccus bachuensis]|uniref:Relaxase/mobilization nuclease-like protein n=1 Tax=Salinicoccus bachuensis TaxID=3136731 RepID=A0ABZ3CK89_9STAP
MKIIEKKMKFSKSKCKEIQPREIARKIGKFSAKAGRSAVILTRRKMEENSIREAARYHYYWQFSNEQLQDMHDRTDSMRAQGAIKAVMKKRGYKYDFEIDMFRPADSVKMEKSGKVHLLENRKIQSYEEIESRLREQKANRPPYPH